MEERDAQHRGPATVQPGGALESSARKSRLGEEQVGRLFAAH
jgi:hypothetical protein